MLSISPETLLILALVVFIVGLIIGVVLARPAIR